MFGNDPNCDDARDCNFLVGIFEMLFLMVGRVLVAVVTLVILVIVGVLRFLVNCVREAVDLLPSKRGTP